MTPWRWRQERTQGIWKYGPAWLRPFAAAMPWLTVLLLLLMLHMVGGTFVMSRGALFELPDAGLAEGESTSLVALAMPRGAATMVFFDDARYMLDDPASVATFRSHLAERTGKVELKTMLILADRRIPGGDLMRLAALAKGVGVTRILFAEKKTETKVE